jgi:regulatory LuxR family protein
VAGYHAINKAEELVILPYGSGEIEQGHRLSAMQTEATVKVHVKAIFRKIRVKNRTQAAIWALHLQALGKAEQVGNGEVALAERA